VSPVPGRHEVSPLVGSAPLARWPALVTACLGMMAAFLVITASIAILTPMAQALHISSADEVWVASNSVPYLVLPLHAVPRQPREADSALLAG
jgi:hypothetical protein